MQIEVYADILFLINFIMIYFIFFIVNKLIKNKVPLKRIFLGSFFATFFYILIIFCIPFYKILSIILIIFIIFLSIFISFRPKRIKDFLSLLLLINIISFSIGGTSIALFYYINLNNILGNMLNSTIKNFSLKLLLISVSFTYIILKFFINWYKKIFIKKQSFYVIKLYKNSEKIILNALLDTGNSLKEPITKKPVMIAEFFAIKNILPESLKIIFYQKEENNLNRILEVSYDNHIRFIPFKSIGKENGLMLGIKIDKLEIEADKNIVLTDVIVAISNFSLSEDGFYNAILNPEMLK